MREFKAQQVKDCYNRTAQQYAQTYLNELEGKPFDRNLLDRFSAMLPQNGVIYDFGCGSGHTTRYLHKKERQTVVGLDFAENAIQLARQNFPQIDFRVDDILHSRLPEGSADGIVAFYAIVHFSYSEVERALSEWRRLLKQGGICIFSFHCGIESIDVQDFLGVTGANATWNFFDADRVVEISERCGFKVDEALVRFPYRGQEHESKRAYVMLRSPMEMTR